MIVKVWMVSVLLNKAQFVNNSGSVRITSNAFVCFSIPVASFLRKSQYDRLIHPSEYFTRPASSVDSNSMISTSISVFLRDTGHGRDSGWFCGKVAFCFLQKRADKKVSRPLHSQVSWRPGTTRPGDCGISRSSLS